MQRWVLHLLGSEIAMPWNEVPDKWKAGTLRSGGPGGPKVKKQSQMVAIMLSEKRKAKTGKSEYAAKVRKPRQNGVPLSSLLRAK
jgi:hypothetical protein